MHIVSLSIASKKHNVHHIQLIMVYICRVAIKLLKEGAKVTLTDINGMSHFISAIVHNYVTEFWKITHMGAFDT